MKDNELIANFMGQQLSPAFRECMPDWNQLMLVIDRVNELYNKAFPGNEEFIRRILAHEEPLDGPYMDVIALPLSTPYEKVLEAVVTFIKWFNNSQTPHP